MAEQGPNLQRATNTKEDPRLSEWGSRMSYDANGLNQPPVAPMRFGLGATAMKEVTKATHTTTDQASPNVEMAHHSSNMQKKDQSAGKRKRGRPIKDTILIQRENKHQIQLQFKSQSEAWNSEYERLKNIYGPIEKNDSTIPKALYEREVSVQKLLEAMLSTSDAEDAFNINVPQSALEKICWDLETLAFRVHVQGPEIFSIYDESIRYGIQQELSLTYAQRIGNICVLLSRKKCHVRTLLRGDSLSTTVAAPGWMLNSIDTFVTGPETKSFHNTGMGGYVATHTHQLPSVTTHLGIQNNGPRNTFQPLMRYRQLDSLEAASTRLDALNRNYLEPQLAYHAPKTKKNVGQEDLNTTSGHKEVTDVEKW